MAPINNAFQAADAYMKEGTFNAVGERKDWTYYDDFVLAAATQEFNLFQVQLGGAGKLLMDTNLTTAGQIPKSQKMTVRALKIWYSSLSAKATADVLSFYQFLARTTAELIITNKYTMGQWTLQELLGASTLFNMTPTAAGDNIPLAQPRFHGIFPLNIPIVLAEQTPIRVNIRLWAASAAALNGDLVHIGLNGTLEALS